MNTCEQWRERISAMDPPDPPEAAALESHLQTCPECRRYRDTLRALADFVVEDSPAVPLDFTEGVMEAVYRKDAPAKKTRSRRTIRWLGTLAAALLVAFAGARLSLPARMAEARTTVIAPMRADEAAGSTEAFAVTEESAELADAAPEEELKTAPAESAAAAEPAEGEELTGAIEEERALLYGDTAENGMMTFRMGLCADADADAADDSAFLWETVLPGSEAASEPPEGEWDCALSDGESLYYLWLRDGRVFWQRDGEETVYLSPAGAEAVEAYIYGDQTPAGE